MNIIVVCCDTFRYDHLGLRGPQGSVTPNLEQFAAESAIFTDYRLCSFPTVVNRIEAFTGRYTFPFNDWGGLPLHYPVFAEVFKRHAYETALIADNPHLMKEGRGFRRGFDFVKDVPGQADDPFQPPTAPVAELPCPMGKLEPRRSRLERYRRNARWYQHRDISTTSEVFREAIRWLTPARNRFFLWIDSFDPHEPWDAPARYREGLPWRNDGDAVIWPHNGKASRYSEADLCNMRTLYRAEIRQSDEWIGQLLEHLRRTGLLETTAVIFCSDHGFYLGEHGLLGKLRMGRPTTFYEELGHIPLVVRHPAGLAAGQKISGLCQPTDLFATAMELAGIRRVPWAQGNSLVPRLYGQPSPQRFAVGGCFPRKKSKGSVACLSVWSDEWTLIYSPFEGLSGSELYHRGSDPAESRNVIAEHPQVARQHFEWVKTWLEELGTPAFRQRQLLHAEPLTLVKRVRHVAWKLGKARFFKSRFGDYAPLSGAN